MRKNLMYLCFISVLMATSSPVKSAAIYRTYSYYTISAHTAEEIDKAFAKKGPFLKLTGNRHPGASYIRFQPDIKLQQRNKYCRVEKAKIDIHATILLPHWKQRAKANSPDLAILWDVLSADMKRHEESHIIIARAHASEIEYALRPLRRCNCVVLNQEIQKIFATTLAQHDEAQQTFERAETRNFNKRFIRLLEQQFEIIKFMYQKNIPK